MPFRQFLGQSNMHAQHACSVQAAHARASSIRNRHVDQSVLHACGLRDLVGHTCGYTCRLACTGRSNAGEKPCRLHLCVLGHLIHSRLGHIGAWLGRAFKKGWVWPGLAKPCYTQHFLKKILIKSFKLKINSNKSIITFLKKHQLI